MSGISNKFLGSKRTAILAVLSLVGSTLLSISTPIAANAATLTVCASGCDQTSIQAAINAASDGDTINIGAGTYSENLTISKNVKLIGAGTGSDGTIVTAYTASTPVIKITGSGTATTDRLTVSYMKITGGTGGANAGPGIYLANGIGSGGAISNISIDHVLTTGNIGHGISVNNTASVTDLSITNSTISGNTGAGIRVASAVPTMDGLTIADTTISSNTGAGIDENPSSSVVTHTNYSFTRVTFTSNDTALVNNTHDVSILGFTGNLSMDSVTVTAANNNKGHAIAIGGKLSSYGPAGNISLNNVTVSGYAKSAIYFLRFSGLSTVTMSNVNIVGLVANWVYQLVADNFTTSLNIGNTALKTLKNGSTGTINASSANFKDYVTGNALNANTFADAIQISKQVYAVTDAAGYGSVTIKTGNRYVTPADINTGTVAGGLARNIGAASAGDVINVGAGTYAEDVNVNKSLSLKGVQAGVPATDAARSGGESILSGATTVTVSANDVILDGFKVAATIAGVKVSSAVSNLTVKNNWMSLVDGSPSAIAMDLTNVSESTINDNYLAGTAATVGATSSTFNGNTLSGTSVLTLPSGSDVSVANNNFAGPSGIVYNGSAALIRNNYFSNATDDISAIRIANQTGSNLNATNNYWGESTGPGVEDRVSGDVTTSPYLSAFTPDATKTGATGFWPTAPNYVATLPAGTTEATVELGTVGAIDLGLAPSDTAVEVVVSEVASPDESAAPFQVGNAEYFDLAITGIAEGTSVTICVASATDQKLWHYENSAWVDITSSYDNVNHVLCGTTSSFSPFVLSPVKLDTSVGYTSKVSSTAIESSNYGDDVEFAATIADSAATGAVTIKIDGTAFDSCVAESISDCKSSIATLGTGDHTVLVEYVGDDVYNSASSSSTFTVNEADVDSADLVRTGTLTFGENQTFAATVDNTVATDVSKPSGDVKFYLDGDANSGTYLDVCTLSSQTCSIDDSTLSVGAHSVTMIYQGDTNYNTATDTVEFTISEADSVATASVSTDPSTYGDGGVDLQVSVAGVSGATDPSGEVSLYLNGQAASDLVDTCALSSGSCSIASSDLAAGSYTLYADYAGDSNYNSDSDSVGFTVNQADGIVVTPNNFTLVYGTAPSGALYSATGFHGEDGWQTPPTCVITNNVTSATPAFDASTPKGTYTLSCSGGDAGSNYKTTDHSATGTVTITQAPTTLDYTGAYYLASGTTVVALQATMSGVCASGAAISFWYDSNGDGTYETKIGDATASSGGVANYNWTLPAGTVYEVEVKFVDPSTNCADAAAQSTIVVGSAGDSSNGGGWYNQNGKVTFGYTVQVKTVKTTTTVGGQVVWSSKNGNRFKGTVSSYTITACSGFGVTATKCGLISGTGYVYNWNLLTSSWVKQPTSATFNMKVADGGTSTVCSTVKKVTTCTTSSKPDYLGMQISNYALSGESAAVLQLKGGNIVVK